MKCFDCGTKLTVNRENVRYECGLPNVTLLDVEVNRCPRCGYKETVIPKVEELHRQIALQLVTGSGRFGPDEIRFLRRYIGCATATEFAREFRVTPETVSRWEKGRSPMEPAYEQLLRLWVVNFGPGVDDVQRTNQAILKRTTSVAEDPRRRLEASLIKGAWKLGQAA